MAMRRRNISARESLCKRFASQSAFVRHTGMASRFVGAPDLTGYGPRRFRMRMAAASTKASKFLFETISSGTGRDEVGAGYGVDYVSTRRVSSGDFPKLKDWPPLAEKEYDHWKRKVLSLATVMPALARILGSNPPDAPTMEALLRVYDLDAVYEAFMEGSYYVFPAEQADGFASSDERYGTNALSCQVFRKGAPAWDLSDAINEYEERKGMPAMEPSVRPVRPVGTPVSGVPSAADVEAHVRWRPGLASAPTSKFVRRRQQLRARCESQTAHGAAALRKVRFRQLPRSDSPAWMQPAHQLAPSTPRAFRSWHW